jgi:hypothetical protein
LETARTTVAILSFGEFHERLSLSHGKRTCTHLPAAAGFGWRMWETI